MKPEAAGTVGGGPKLVARRPTFGFLGVHAGRHVWRPVSQNETVAGLFEQSGYRVFKSSDVLRPSLRTVHHLGSLAVWRDVDVVVVAMFSGRSFWIADYATALGRLLGKRLVLFLHGGNLPVFGAEHRRWVERVFRRADLVLAPSQFLASSFRDWGLDIRIVPNVLTIENYDYHQRGKAAPNLLWMRTFHEHYDPVMALRVFRRVRERFPDATMTMAGADQGLLASTLQATADLGLTDSVTFPGYMNMEAKREAFASHDIFVNTNVVDNTPVSVLEACASGLAVVSTDVGGIPSLIQSGRNGVLVPEGDDVAMADAVLQLLDRPDHFSEISAAGRATAEEFAWDTVKDRWVDQLALAMPEFEL